MMSAQHPNLRALCCRLEIEVQTVARERGSIKGSHLEVALYLQDPDGHELEEPYEIDLSKKLSVMIAAVGLHTPL